MSDAAKTGLIAAAILAGFALVAGALVFSSRDDERFRIVQARYADFLLDTQSGKAWRYYRNNDPKTGVPTAEGFQWLPVQPPPTTQGDPLARMTAEEFLNAPDTNAPKYDPSQFELVEPPQQSGGTSQTNAPKFDPSKPFEVIRDPAGNGGATNRGR
jgi:hypothetical protein